MLDVQPTKSAGREKGMCCIETFLCENVTQAHLIASVASAISVKGTSDTRYLNIITF